MCSAFPLGKESDKDVESAEAIRQIGMPVTAVEHRCSSLAKAKPIEASQCMQPALHIGAAHVAYSIYTAGRNFLWMQRGLPLIRQESLLFTGGAILRT